MGKTYNFKLEQYDYKCPDSCIGEFKDHRNGFVCINPTVDLDCYINYIELLNLHKDKWQNYGYLDLGMMPLAMGPSFMQSSLVKSLTEIMKACRVKCYSLPPVSLMYSSCKLPVNDIWVFKSDISKMLGIPEDKVTTEKLLLAIKNGVRGGI